MKISFLAALVAVALADDDEDFDIVDDLLVPIVGDTVVETLDYKFKGPLVEIANDEDVELNLFHWVIDGKLFF